MADIEFKKVVKSYGDVKVIKSLDLSIKDKEFMVLVGPSGCGKSTTLRMIAGLEEITEGDLFIGERRVNNVHPKDRDVAMVFQSYALYPHMSVRENIAFGLRLRKMPKDEIDTLVDEAAKTLGLTPLLDRKPKALSGGQRQRVALGRAIVRKPSVFLFDEPLSNLDAELRVQMRAEIAKLQKRLAITSVYVTHDQVEAMTMGDRIAVLHDGDLRQVGTPLELYDTPANLFVAQFIGTPNMNVAKGNISEDGSKISIGSIEFAVPAKWKDACKANAGKPIHVGFRPEHTLPDDEHDWKNTARLSGHVDIVETLGHEVVVYVTIEGLDKRVIAKADVHKTPTPGDAMSVDVNLDELHLFDGETDERLSS
ncbi:sn-glycerol-3-phosphate ABC transporter ATP-binding protein UgpC [Natronospirillum operosum]|uniref:sn-glycerol-3-phosphate ABC transporter ATP-binding protein UgpC n=1 Tax=Natronospirillum operosum TaxID=2759953 RepID=A0A4Z0W9Q4_9GAMM|nr:sn-glycerol-3-phosphate ABC transporter ATP-binding protein UgpC [Natronospirillum operosum]TGG95349.1 sn-glycerol-3-phosphate ABC transporter ATP-binding protein UgpC [Natronospirillum operosum]